MTHTPDDESGVNAWLRTGHEQQQAQKRAFLAKLDHSSLSALGDSAVTVKKAEEEQAQQARDERHARLRDEWARRYLDRWSATLTRCFGEELGLPADSPLLAEVKWSFDMDLLTRATFHERNDGAIEALSGEIAALYPVTRVDVLAIQAAPISTADDDDDAVRFRFTGVYPGGSQGIRDAHDLGQALQGARKYHDLWGSPQDWDTPQDKEDES